MEHIWQWSDEEESSNIENHWYIQTDYSEILSSLISKLWGERDIHTNTDYSVTGWMVCVITHIYEDVFYISNGNNSNQVKNVTKTPFYD